MAELDKTLSDLIGQLKVSDSDTPLIRWCIVAIAVTAVWFWVVEPLQTWQQGLSAQLERNGAKASRIASLEKNRDAWAEAESQALQIMADIGEGFFASPSDTASHSLIQQVLQDFALSRQLDLESQKLIVAESLKPLGNKLAVEVGVRGELIHVLQYLDDISRTDKLFLIDRWIIQMDRNNKAYARFIVAGIRPLSSEEQLQSE